MKTAQLLMIIFVAILSTACSKDDAPFPTYSAAKADAEATLEDVAENTESKLDDEEIYVPEEIESEIVNLEGFWISDHHGDFSILYISEYGYLWNVTQTDLSKRNLPIGAFTINETIDATFDEQVQLRKTFGKMDMTGRLLWLHIMTHESPEGKVFEDGTEVSEELQLVTKMLKEKYQRTFVLDSENTLKEYSVFPTDIHAYLAANQKAKETNLRLSDQEFDFVHATPVPRTYSRYSKYDACNRLMEYYTSEKTKVEPSYDENGKLIVEDTSLELKAFPECENSK